MSGPFERQGIHIPEPERATVVMAAPLAARLHTHHSAVPQPHGLPSSSEGGCSAQTHCEKGSIPLPDCPQLTPYMTVTRYQAQTHRFWFSLLPQPNWAVMNFNIQSINSQNTTSCLPWAYTMLLNPCCYSAMCWFCDYNRNRAWLSSMSMLPPHRHFIIFIYFYGM